MYDHFKIMFVIHCDGVCVDTVVWGMKVGIGSPTLSILIFILTYFEYFHF